MDMDSSEKGLDEMSDVHENDGSASAGELDLNFAIDKEDKGCDCFNENTARTDNIHVDLNQHDQQGLPSLPVDFRDGISESPHDKFHSVPTEFDQDDLRRTKFDYEQDRTESPFKDNHYQGEMDELHGSYFHKSSSQFKAQTFYSERGTEDFAHSQEYPLTADANQGEKMEGNSDLDRPHDNNIKEFEKSQYQFIQPVYGEIEGEASDHQTGKTFSSPRGHASNNEHKNEKFYYSRNSPTVSGKMDQSHQSHSSLHSHGSTPERSTLPVTVRQMSVSPEMSPCVHQSANGHKPLSSQQGIKDPTCSHRLHRRKHPSPERSDLGKKSPSQDQLYPSARQTSTSPRRSQQGSRHKDVSSLKRISVSPKTRYSPQSDRRQGRSASRSPIRQRDFSSKYKRDYRDRSRSRSPYARDRHASSRRRYSPRQRSPPSSYHSRRRSPRRRPWSPPPNRSTGLGKPGKNLFVAGFSFLTTERDLERKFSRFGRVRDVRIVRDKRSGDSRGFGFLSLERDEDADAAIKALDETEWNGRIILVEKSNSSGR